MQGYFTKKNEKKTNLDLLIAVSIIPCWMVYYIASVFKVETKPLHVIKRVPQCNYIGSTVVV